MSINARGDNLKRSKFKQLQTMLGVFKICIKEEFEIDAYL